MKPARCLFLFLFVAWGCEKAAPPDCTPESWTYTLQKGKQIVIDTILVTAGDSTFARYAYNVKDGSNLVFTYLHLSPDCKHIADDEQAEKLLFELPASATALTLQDSASFAQAKVLYQRIGAWSSLLPALITSGQLQAFKKESNRWHIVATLRIPGQSALLHFEHDFLP